MSTSKKEDQESYGDWFKRCQQFCFEKVLKVCDDKKWYLLDKIDKRVLDELTDERGRSLLIAAIQELEAESVETLLHRGIAIHRKDSNKNTALHIAVEMGRAALIPHLQRYGFIGLINSQGENSLHVAIRCGHARLIPQLVKYGESLSKTCRYHGRDLSPLALSIAVGYVECLDQVAKQAEADFTTLTSGIGNLLHVALNSKNPFILRHLLTNYSNKVQSLINDPRGNENLTPLAVACAMGQVDAVELLIEKKADPNKVDANGRTPAHHAAINHQIEVLERLAYLDVDLTIEDTNHKTPMMCLKEGHGTTIEFDVNRLQIAMDNQRRGLKEAPDFTIRPPHNLVFQGGGPRGLAYVGVLGALEEQGSLKELRRVAGTSAGAISATLLAVGYTSGDLHQTMMNLDMKTLLVDPTPENEKLVENLLKAKKTDDRTIILNYFLKENINNILRFKSPMELYRHLARMEGLCEGERFRKWIDGEIEKRTGKKNCTFGELAELINTKGYPYKHLHVYATQLNPNPTSVCFSTSDKQCADVIISDAVRASMSIPGVFKPHEIHYKDSGNSYSRYTKKDANGDVIKFVDGGLLRNFPLDEFDSIEYQTPSLPVGTWNKKRYNHRTLGLSLYDVVDENETEQNKNIDGIADLFQL